MNDVPDGLTYLDTGFYRISTALAKEIGGGTLPKHGRERLVIWQRRYLWLARTVHRSKQVWSVRDSGGWKFNETGGMVLHGRIDGMWPVITCADKP